MYLVQIYVLYYTKENAILDAAKCNKTTAYKYIHIKSGQVF